MKWKENVIYYVSLVIAERLYSVVPRSEFLGDTTGALSKILRDIVNFWGTQIIASIFRGKIYHYQSGILPQILPLLLIIAITLSELSKYGERLYTYKAKSVIFSFQHNKYLQRTALRHYMWLVSSPVCSYRLNCKQKRKGRGLDNSRNVKTGGKDL